MMSMIGFTMLLGLVTKNAILLIDYANQQREKGLDIRSATLEACSLRLRPILMTTLSTILGMLPIAMGIGEGAELRQSMGVVLVGGLITSTMLTLLVVPVVYMEFEKWKENIINLPERQTHNKRGSANCRAFLYYLLQKINENYLCHSSLILYNKCKV